MPIKGAARTDRAERQELRAESGAICTCARHGVTPKHGERRQSWHAEALSKVRWSKDRGLGIEADPESR